MKYFHRNSWNAYFTIVSLCKLPIKRSSHQRCSVRKGVLRNFAKFTGKRNLLKKRDSAQMFSREFCEISKNIFTEHLWWLLLDKCSWYTFWSLSWNLKIVKIDLRNFLYRERLLSWFFFHAWLILLESAKLRALAPTCFTHYWYAPERLTHH